MRKSFLALLTMTLSLVFLPAINSASAQENCRTFNFREVFNFGYNPEFPTWTSPGVKRVITWVALDTGELNGKKIQRSIGTQHQGWLREAFQSWDEALDTISFQEVNVGNDADIKIGWTQVSQLDYESLFEVKTAQPTRSSASIELKTGSAFLIFRENFIQVVQSDIGHILGMGYITPTPNVVSVMEWPFQAPYGQIPLGEFDVGLIRAIYSESTCPSTFSPVIQSKIREIEDAKTLALAKLVAEAKAVADAKAAETKAAAIKAAAAKVAAEKAKLAASKKIVCKKGSQVKSFVASKCPPGWAKSKN